MSLPKLLCASAILSAFAVSSHAAVVDSVSVVDNIYGPFSGAISDTDTGPAAILNWDSAVSGAIFSIDFTNAAGTITDVLFSGAGRPAVFPGDSLEFDGANSGNPLIGTSCVAGGNTVCLEATGTWQDLVPTLGSIGVGICCETSDIQVLVGDAVPAPEPASFALLGTGLMAFAAALTVARRQSR